MAEMSIRTLYTLAHRQSLLVTECHCNGLHVRKKMAVTTLIRVEIMKVQIESRTEMTVFVDI